MQRSAIAALAGATLVFTTGALAADPGTAYPGFRLGDPPGEGWRQVQRNAASIVWMKRLTWSPNTSYCALASPAV